MKTMTVDEWNREGKKRFGDNTKDWKFKCVACGNVQSMRDFEGLVDDPGNYVHFSCIGRLKNGVGCNWTLGGFLQTHELEVIDNEGNAHPMFEFA